MTKLKWLLAMAIPSLLSILLVGLVGCAGHPKGLDAPRHLTSDENARAIEIALNVPEVQQQLKTTPYDTAEINWLAVTWNGSKWSAYYHIDAEWETDPNLNNVPDSAVFYPYVLIHFTEPAALQFAVAIDLDKGKVVLVHAYPANKGPVQLGLD